MRRIRSKLRDESGAAIALIALSMVALISAIALAVDVGMLLTARTEAQRVADLSALAGAGVLAVLPDAETAARAKAIEFAALNTIQGDAAVVLPGDVAVDLDSSTVTVQVMRIQARGTPVGTFFARIFGVNSVNITAVATAIAESPGDNSGTNCLLPIMLPDRWSEGDDILNPGPWPAVDDSFDPLGSSVPGSKDSIPDWYDRSITGYDQAVFGDVMQIHASGGGGGGLHPSNYFPWTPFDEADQLLDGGPGAATYQSRFTKCLQGGYLVGDSVLTEPGAMVGPTNDGFAAAIAMDPDMTWDPDQNCPWYGSGECEATGSRIRSMPMFDPSEGPSSGRKIVHITNFGSVFLELVEPGNTYTVRWMGVLASTPNPEPPKAETLLKYIHLIR